MFDITRPSSLHNIEEWLTVFNPEPNNPTIKTPILMVGGKSDLESQRVIQYEEGRLISEKYNFEMYFECSSINSQNVEEVFENLTLLMMKNANLI
jgi:GTPase SAR1 family protein